MMIAAFGLYGYLISLTCTDSTHQNQNRIEEMESLYGLYALPIALTFFLSWYSNPDGLFAVGVTHHIVIFSHHGSSILTIGLWLRT
jgi:hypothetical protein